MKNKQPFLETESPTPGDPHANKKTRHYTPEFKAAALAMMEQLLPLCERLK